MIAGGAFGALAGTPLPVNMASGAIIGGVADYVGQVITHELSDREAKMCTVFKPNWGSTIGSAVGGATFGRSDAVVRTWLKGLDFSDSAINTIMNARSGIYSIGYPVVGSRIWDVTHEPEPPQNTTPIPPAQNMTLIPK